MDMIKHAILPVTALAVPQIAEYMRYARAATLDSLGHEHVVTARSKGLSERVIFWRHVFRNALIPMMTILGLSLPGVIGGSFVIETIFSWPGIGMLGYTAIMQRDYPIQLGIALMAATAVLLANLVTDIAYAVVDPRIRYE
jgi:peptide/nickel transport system permease protein